jgi:hypothetical protein
MTADTARGEETGPCPRCGVNIGVDALLVPGMAHWTPTGVCRPVHVPLPRGETFGIGTDFAIAFPTRHEAERWARAIRECETGCPCTHCAHLRAEAEKAT